VTAPPPNPTPSGGTPAPNPRGQVPPGGHIPQQSVPPGFPRPAYPAPPSGYPNPPGYPTPPGYLRPPAPPPVSPAGQPLAEFSDRFLAGLVDYGIFVVLSMIFAAPVMIIYFTRIVPELFQVNPDGTIAEPDVLGTMLPMILMQLGVSVTLLMLMYVYHVEMMFRTGQTLGKRIMKIRVVPLDPTATLNRGFAVRRFLVQFGASWLVPGFAYLDGLWQLWDKPYQQCLHDKAARTVVVKVPRVNELRLAP
jgi:uncharacterized RDD family membrane protein YckC